MQSYIDMAEKNGIVLQEHGKCQFCGANTARGIHECMELFNLGFQFLDYSKKENHRYRFLSVDAHTLQHPEIHGRWSNHFHLTRQHLMFAYNVEWNYSLSPRLSDYLNAYKSNKIDEFLQPPAVFKRGKITATYIIHNSKNESQCQQLVEEWGKQVYKSWNTYHKLIDAIARGFINNTPFITQR